MHSPSASLGARRTTALAVHLRCTPPLKIAARIQLVSLFLNACGGERAPLGSLAASPKPEWPRRVTLVTNPGTASRGGVWLADGSPVTNSGDLLLDQAQVLSLVSPAPGSICELGTFSSLANVPSAADRCPTSLSGTWQQRAYLGAATRHTREESQVVGRGLLVRDAAYKALYRLRVLNDSHDVEVATATFVYEPVP